MKKGLYSLFDKKIQAYMTPMVSEHEGSLVRGVQDAVNSGEKSDISNHPEDFDLYKLGEVDLETGILIPQQPKPVFIVNAGIFRRNENERNSQT